jgi:hypothetical protein
MTFDQHLSSLYTIYVYIINIIIIYNKFVVLKLTTSNCIIEKSSLVKTIYFSVDVLISIMVEQCMNNGAVREGSLGVV